MSTSCDKNHTVTISKEEYDKLRKDSYSLTLLKDVCSKSIAKVGL